MSVRSGPTTPMTRNIGSSPMSAPQSGMTNSRRELDEAGPHLVELLEITRASYAVPVPHSERRASGGDAACGARPSRGPGLGRRPAPGLPARWPVVRRRRPVGLGRRRPAGADRWRACCPARRTPSTGTSSRLDQPLERDGPRALRHRRRSRSSRSLVTTSTRSRRRGRPPASPPRRSRSRIMSSPDRRPGSARTSPGRAARTRRARCRRTRGRWRRSGDRRPEPPDDRGRRRGADRPTPRGGTAGSCRRRSGGRAVERRAREGPGSGMGRR